jgi:hypothetical protein
MRFDWQYVLVTAVLLAAAAYVMLRSWRAVRGKKSAGCGGCGTCATSSAKSGTTRSDTLLQIDEQERS